MRSSWLDTIDPPIQWVDRLPQLQRHHVSGAPRIVNGQDCAVDQLCVRLAERWFGELTDKAVRRGAFRSVPQLITAIQAFLEAHNSDPRPFVWTAKAEDIIAKVRRGRAALMQSSVNSLTAH